MEEKKMDLFRQLAPQSLPLPQYLHRQIQVPELKPPNDAFCLRLSLSDLAFGPNSRNFAGIGSETDGDNSPSRPRVGDMPESCVAAVLIYLDPPEVFSLARLNRAFCGASSADFIWEGKLPPNYRVILEKVLDEPKMVSMRKKEIYSKLCAPNSID